MKNYGKTLEYFFRCLTKTCLYQTFLVKPVAKILQNGLMSNYKIVTLYFYNDFWRDRGIHNHNQPFSLHFVVGTRESDMIMSVSCIE